MTQACDGWPNRVGPPRKRGTVRLRHRRQPKHGCPDFGHQPTFLPTTPDRSVSRPGEGHPSSARQCRPELSGIGSAVIAEHDQHCVADPDARPGDEEPGQAMNDVTVRCGPAVWNRDRPVARPGSAPRPCDVTSRRRRPPGRQAAGRAAGSSWRGRSRATTPGARLLM